MKKIHISIIALIIISFLIAISIYNILPEKVASHWNEKGEVDGYMSRFWGIFLTPLIMIACFLLLIFLPKLDPLKRNIKKFEKYYDLTIFIIIAFLLYVHILTILANVGVAFNMNYPVILGVAVLFYFLGIILPKCKRNWFIGIRTPWTLSSDKVWAKTHRLGGKLFRIFAIILALTLLVPDYSIVILLITIFIVIIYLVVYSYLQHKKEKK
jgi:uncharacterized membrane protein